MIKIKILCYEDFCALVLLVLPGQQYRAQSSSADTATFLTPLHYKCTPSPFFAPTSGGSLDSLSQQGAGRGKLW